MSVLENFPLEQRLFFRNELREARAAALSDAEGFEPVAVAFERLGSFLCPDGKNLGQYRDALIQLAERGYAAARSGYSESIASVPALFQHVKNGRNDAVHQGAHARHLVRHCVEFALLLEGGLLVGERRVEYFMVNEPVRAEMWHPVAFARQRMLMCAFSYLPIRDDGSWKLLSDHAIARYMSRLPGPDALRERIETVVRSRDLTLESAVQVGRHESIDEALKKSDGKPLLVCDGESLVGIATSFDFL